MGTYTQCDEHIRRRLSVTQTLVLPRTTHFIPISQLHHTSPSADRLSVICSDGFSEPELTIYIVVGKSTGSPSGFSVRKPRKTQTEGKCLADLFSMEKCWKRPNGRAELSSNYHSARLRLMAGVVGYAVLSVIYGDR